MEIIFATRPSALARWQTRWVIEALSNAFPGLLCKEHVITTQGDRVIDRSLPEIGGKGVFTQELESELLSGQVQAAVHSLKDLPVEQPAGLMVGAVPARADVRDALLSRSGGGLNDLPAGALVGTSSLRRSAQLLAVRPDLDIRPLRGNVDTRLRKLQQGEYDAIVLAGAGLVRLGLDHHVSQWLPLDVMLPAPGQGALAVQCRENDERTRQILAVLENPPTRRAVDAERAFLAALGGGCAVPVAAYARATPDGLALDGVVASLDGERLIHVTAHGDDPISVGRQCADLALAAGAAEILAVLRRAE